MFTDIVTSTDLVGAHRRRRLERAPAAGTTASCARRSPQHRGEEVNHTGDGFFVAFERAADGIECAVDIQRRLVRHRREHGFAVGVRIGLHAAPRRASVATTRPGVHVAARVGAAAAKDEILVTQAVLDGAGSIRFGLSEPRELTLKGVREPVEVRAVDWR